jgi:dephospho-CoA kinase
LINTNYYMPTHAKKKIILGLVGEIASGKDTVADYLKKKYKSETVSFSQPLRDMLSLVGLEQSRINLSNLGRILRKQFGQDILSRAMAVKVDLSKAPIITLPNVRLEEDIIWLKKLPGFYLVHIDTDVKVRFERLKKRKGQYVDDATKTWAQFQKDSRLYTERNIRSLFPKCKLKLNNNGSKQELYRQIDELAKKLKLKKASR